MKFKKNRDSTLQRVLSVLVDSFSVPRSILTPGTRLAELHRLSPHAHGYVRLSFNIEGGFKVTLTEAQLKHLEGGMATVGTVQKMVENTLGGLCGLSGT